MPVSNTRVAEYHYELRSTSQEHVAIVYLLGEDGHLLCMTAFVDGVAPLPGPREDVQGHVFVTLPRSALGDVIDLLRNERPAYFRWASETQVAALVTTEEPVGEEESRSLLSFLFGRPDG